MFVENALPQISYYHPPILPSHQDYHNHHQSVINDDSPHILAGTTTPVQTSEHGHDLTSIDPMSKHSGSSVNTFFNGLFTTIIAIATLGTSVTFSYVLSNQTVPPPETARYSPDQIQLFLSISWLLFLLALAFAALSSTLLTFFKRHWIRDWDGACGRTSQWTVQMYAFLISCLLGSLITAAFVFLCLVVVAYQPVVGWVSLGFTAGFGMVILAGVCNQVPRSRSTRGPDLNKEESLG